MHPPEEQRSSSGGFWAGLNFSAQPDSVSIPITCCFDVANRKIPIQRLESYQRITSTQCHKKAVIFRTKLGKEVCANPKEKWVKDSMKHLDAKSQALKL